MNPTTPNIEPKPSTQRRKAVTGGSLMKISKRVSSLLSPCRGLAVVALLLFGGAQTAHAQNFTVTDLGTLGGDRSSARAVNDSGQVVGYSSTAGGANHAFSWTQAGGIRSDSN